MNALITSVRSKCHQCDYDKEAVRSLPSPSSKETIDTYFAQMNQLLTHEHQTEMTETVKVNV